MNKQLRRKIGHHVHEIGVSFNAEEDKPQGPEVKETYIQQKKPSKRRRWSVLEVFTWTCAISLVASAREWTFHEPVTLPHWDLMKTEDYDQALNYIDRVEPDLLVLAWPWTMEPIADIGKEDSLSKGSTCSQKRREPHLAQVRAGCSTAPKKKRRRCFGGESKAITGVERRAHTRSL